MIDERTFPWPTPDTRAAIVQAVQHWNRDLNGAADQDIEPGPADRQWPDRRAGPGDSAPGSNFDRRPDARPQQPYTMKPSTDDALTTADRLDTATQKRLVTAADLAPQRYPGAIGDLLRQELLSWRVFGLHLGSSLIMRVADDLVADADGTPQGGWYDRVPVDRQ